MKTVTAQHGTFFHIYTTSGIILGTVRNKRDQDQLRRLPKEAQENGGYALIREVRRVLHLISA